MGIEKALMYNSSERFRIKKIKLSFSSGEVPSGLCDDSEKSGIILMAGYKSTVCYFKRLIIEVVINEHPATCGGVYGSFLLL